MTAYDRAGRQLAAACERVVREVNADREWGVGVLEDLAAAITAIGELPTAGAAILRLEAARAALLRRVLDESGDLDAEQLAVAKAIADRCRRLCGGP